MNVVILAHPEYMNSKSMPRFAQMIEAGLVNKGHCVRVWRATPQALRLIQWRKIAKWVAYFDQYVIFNLCLFFRLRREPRDTLFVAADQALGPHLPLIANRPHVVHVHDLLALRTALHAVPENPVALTGRFYQRFIRSGFRHCSNFISVSRKTRDDLHSFGGVKAELSDVVYNGMNHDFVRMPTGDAERTLAEAGHHLPPEGFLLHVSSGSWYKNLPNTIKLYRAFASRASGPVPEFWIVSNRIVEEADAVLSPAPLAGRVRYLGNLSAAALCAAYSLARAKLFLSYEEGFGWPIIESLACGCPVLTTAAAPMSEVGGTHAHYLRRLERPEDIDGWINAGVNLLSSVLEMDHDEAQRLREGGIEWAQGFSHEAAMTQYFEIYQRVLDRRLAATCC